MKRRALVAALGESGFRPSGLSTPWEVLAYHASARTVLVARPAPKRRGWWRLRALSGLGIAGVDLETNSAAAVIDLLTHTYGAGALARRPS